MIIGVGSLSGVKLDAFRSVVSQYPFLKNTQVVGVEVHSRIESQPMTLNRTTQGAKYRAKAAFGGHQLGVGIESGLMPLPGDKSRMIDVCVCVIYDGRNCYHGHSPGFEVPPSVVSLIKNKGLELNNAFQQMQSATAVSATGVVEFLTSGRIDRVKFTKQAIIMALIPFEHPKLYRRE